MNYQCYASLNIGKIFKDKDEAINTYKALKKHPSGKKYTWKINKLSNNLKIISGKQIDIDEKNNLGGI